MSEKPKNVLVTGGTGLIGGEVISVLLSRGWNVRAMARGSSDQEAGERIKARVSRSASRPRPSGKLTCHAGTLTAENLGLPLSAYENLTAILHCAGETAFNEDEKCWATNVGAAERLVELGRRLPHFPRIYFVSTASVCMSPKHSRISEDAVFGGYENGYTRSKRRAEEVFLGSGLDVVVLRPTIVFSRGVEDRKMARAMLWVIPALIELGSAPVDPESRIDIIPVDYAADAIERLLRLPRLIHRTYHISAGAQSAVTCQQFQDAVARVDPRARGITMSSALKGKSAASDSLRERLEESISYYVPFMSADIVYSNARLLQEIPELGASPRVTDYLHTLLGQFAYQEGIEESARP